MLDVQYALHGSEVHSGATRYPVPAGMPQAIRCARQRRTGRDVREVARFMCRSIMLMNAGIVVENGRTDDIFAVPRHDYTRILLHAVLPLPEIG